MNLPSGLNWSAGESASVNEFLNSPVGKKWLAVLLSRKPRVSLESTEKAGLTGAFVAGYEHFFSEIASTRIGGMPTESASAKSIDITRD